MTSQSILDFWFQELNSKQWWEKNPNLDAQIAERFLPTLLAAARGELFDWRTSAEG